jgi:hypothetical protein
LEAAQRNIARDRHAEPWNPEKGTAMKTYAIVGIGLTIVSLVGVVLAQSAYPGQVATQPSKDVAQPAKAPEQPAKDAEKPAREHALLKQLVGEWDMTFTMYMQPDQPPVESKGTDSVRSLGDLWVISEMKTTMMGAAYNGIMSLGYDPDKKQVHGTYIDSFGCVLWVYKGTLNEAGDTLTLETEGPSLDQPGKTARYRETITFKGKDTRSFNSTFESKDGKWVKIVTIEYSRKK